MRIAIAGMGYVGLSLACLLARKHNVIAVDILPERVDAINLGRSPIADKEIENALANSTELSLSATLDALSAYQSAQSIIIATPTDFDEATKYFDTSSIENVLDTIDSAKSDAWVVIKSTVPLGYTKRIRKRYPHRTIIFSPEFLREGHALYDNLHPSRIVVGTTDDRDRPLAERFAEMLATCSLAPDAEIIVTGATEAESIKLFSNTYLALRVAFFNELDTFAESHDLSTRDIIRGVSLDPRIGDFYNNPSFGYGGYCLPKDSKQLLANYRNVPQDLMRAVVQSNTTRKDFIAKRIAGAHPNRVGIYKLAMKSGSDNHRQSSIIGIIKRLHKLGIPQCIFDPTLDGDTFLDIPVITDIDQFKRSCDLIVTNRWSDELSDVAFKVYTRDLWHEN